MEPSKPQNASVSDPKAHGFLKESAFREYLVRIRNQDSIALSELYDQASGLVYSVAMRILDNVADSEEVVVDVFSQVWKSASTWDLGRGSVTAWLILLARSRALDRARWRKSRTSAETTVEDFQQFEANEPDAEQALSMKQQQARVRSAMSVLTSAQRQSLELAFFEGLTHQEISDRLGEPLGTVKSRIRTAMLRLKAELEGTVH